MKLIIWWLALLTILPLLYLGWWKKGLRLILGVTIVAILIVSYYIPREIFSSLIKSEIESEIKNKIKKIDEFIHDASKQETDSEKIKNAKLIIESEERLESLRKELDELKREGKALEFQAKTYIYWHEINSVNSFKNQWVAKWCKEICSSAILFYGEGFNQTLTTKEHKIEERIVKLSENTINFDDYQEKSKEEVREKILEIIKEEDSDYKEFSIVFLKNIDKILKTEVKEMILTLLGQGSDSSEWKYKKESRNPLDGSIEETDAIPNLSKFVFIASSSNSNSEKLEELSKNFRTIEAPLSRNKLIIFILSGGSEIIIFFFLIRSKRKSQNEKLQQLE